MGIRRPESPLSSKHVIKSHNPIQLAAISNYKLAQLTFAPPDLHSLRKTAVIKNMLESIYTSTPAEWLQQMTRWKYFTPESLENMTQEGLEEIFGQYVQIIDAFRPMRVMHSYNEDDQEDYFLNEREQMDADLWLTEEEEEEEEELPLPPTTIPTFTQIPPEESLKNDSNESTTSTVISDNFLLSPPDDDTNTIKRKSLNRLSDTGIIPSAVSQNLASELMNLFDMDFTLDIKLSTAPKIPEPSFNKRKSHRQSQDMMTSLLTEFERIAIENSNNERPPSRMIQSVPKRSSSLRHRQELAPLPLLPVEKTKKKSILRSFMPTKKSTQLLNIPEPNNYSSSTSSIISDESTNSKKQRKKKRNSVSKRDLENKKQWKQINKKIPDDYESPNNSFVKRVSFWRRSPNNKPVAI